MINNEINFEQRMKFEKKTLVRFFALTLPLVSAIFVTTLPFQAANAQVTPAQQQALKSLVATGFTNHYPLKVGSQNFSLPYSINLGQVIAIAADQSRTSLDMILSPTQHQNAPGVFTIQIPRHLLDSKNPSGADTPFRLTLDGHGLSWQQLSATNTDRTLGIYFTAQNGFLEIFGSQIAH
ncbi:MAG: hypothetical protein M3044_02415 [Thermoproteota archaeon]|nr:hypothetical protein [Thermoproteota archaeon]